MKQDRLNLTSMTFALLAWLCFLQPAEAQIRNQVFVGTRPLSMGEAFVAVADDGNAIYWNPAGLGRMERMQVNLAYADIFGLDIKHYYASFISRVYFIPPLTDYLAFGVDWAGFDTNDEELKFSQNQFNFSLAFAPPKNIPLLGQLSVGGNFKYLKLYGALDGNPELDGSGWGWDAGVLYNLGALPYVTNGFQVGLMVHNIGDGLSIKNQRTDRQSKVLHETIRYGLSYRPFSDWPGGKIPLSDPVLAIDVDDRVHVGLEFWLAKTLALRAGWQKDWRTNEQATWAFGLGLKKAVKDLPEVHVDYAFADTPVLPNTKRPFGVSLLIKDNPRAIRIVGAQIENVFASLYRHYEQPGSGIGSIKLKNVTDQPLTAWISFQAKPYTQSQSADTVIVPPRSSIDFPLRAVFNSQILYANEGRLNGEVKINYEYKKAQHATTGAVDFALCGKNYLTWDDPGKAAAFVTDDDPLVRTFVDQALKKAPAFDDASWFSQFNMSQAMIIFRALQAYGIRYRADPVTPFAALKDTLRGSRFRLDKIQYPAELLAKDDRAGDCDDLSALYASMLQYAGLPAAFVSGPGHIFIMFDTQIPIAPCRRNLPISPNLFVKRRGTLWIPIETTMIPASTFSEAWRRAANTIDSTWQIYDVIANQEKYPPASRGVLRVQKSLAPLPDFAAALDADLAALNLMKNDWLQKVENKLEENAAGLPPLRASKARNVYGVLLGQYDELSRAKEQFQKVLKLDSTFASGWNNLANVEFINGNFNPAEKLYKKALFYNRSNRRTYLNLAMLYQMMIAGAAPRDSANYQRQTDEALLQAAQILEDDSLSAFSLLCLPEESTDGKAAGWGDKVKARMRKVKDFVDRAFRTHIQKKEIRGVALDRHGAKGRGEIDADRSALLAWSY